MCSGNKTDGNACEAVSMKVRIKILAGDQRKTQYGPRNNLENTTQNKPEDHKQPAWPSNISVY